MRKSPGMRNFVGLAMSSVITINGTKRSLDDLQPRSGEGSPPTPLQGTAAEITYSPQTRAVTTLHLRTVGSGGTGGSNRT